MPAKRRGTKLGLPDPRRAGIRGRLSVRKQVANIDANVRPVIAQIKTSGASTTTLRGIADALNAVDSRPGSRVAGRLRVLWFASRCGELVDGRGGTRWPEWCRHPGKLGAWVAVDIGLECAVKLSS